MRKKWANVAGWLTALGKLGTKAVSLFTKLAKVLKLGHVALAGAAVASYAYLTTWEFCLFMFVALLVHECGHVWAMYRCGMKVRGLYFIPFLGGAVVPEGKMPSRRADAFIALMGPAFGLVLAVIFALLYLMSEWPFLAAVAAWMAALNLLNLLPVFPLDGGRVMRAVFLSVHSWLSIAFLAFSVVVLALVALLSGMILLGMLLLIAMLELLFEVFGAAWARRRLRKEQERINDGYWSTLQVTLAPANVLVRRVPRGTPHAIRLGTSNLAATYILAARLKNPERTGVIALENGETVLLRKRKGKIGERRLYHLGGGWVQPPPWQHPDVPAKRIDKSQPKPDDHKKCADWKAWRDADVQSFGMSPVSIGVYDDISEQREVEKVIPPMNGWEIASVMFFYVLLTAVLFAWMVVCAIAPGADVAMHMLIG